MSVLRRAVGWLAVLYPAALLSIVLAFRVAGERWWITGIILYLPRLAFGLPLPLLVFGLVAAGRPGLLWTQLVASLVLVFPLMGFVIPRSPGMAPSSPTLRVLSYNVNSGHGHGDYADVVAEVERYSPDVAVLVEASFKDKIVPLMRARFASVFVADQFVIASRYPIVDATPASPLGYDGREHSARFLRFVVESSLGRVVGYAVHPISPRESLARVRHVGRRGFLLGRFLSPANAANFYENSGLRELQTEAYAAAVSRETDPVFVAGDTNLPDSSYVLRHYLSALKDGFSETGWGFGYTFPTDKLRPWMRLDRILANHLLRFTHFEVGRSVASDHLCVIADLETQTP
ncbi:MAG: endonuclease/exonuclease/phosphatase family protein [Polyangiaceae bacterium]|jgi:endonuclease/exonuclease/phosphatase (EEP) superfamily protein YafD